MHNVIIVSEKSAIMLQEYKTLFVPFENDGTISFCSWNESGRDLDSALPDLREIIKNKSEWRALVVVAPFNKEELKRQNPFDYEDDDEHLNGFRESEYPAVRLSHMLLGFPAIGVKNFEESISYIDKDSGERVTRYVKDVSEEEAKDLANIYQNDITKTFEEIAYSDSEYTAHKELTDKYSGFEERPQEVLLTTLRYLGEDHAKSIIFSAWEDKLESQSSMFWKRNNYSSGTRFLCYEVSKTDYMSQQREMFEFWSCILCLALNRIKPSTLQAYRLYDMSIDWDYDELGNSINRHLNQLNAIDGAIDERLNRTQVNYDEKKSNLVFNQDVQIILESDNLNQLLMDEFRLNLASDYPQSEKEVWLRDINAKKKEIDSFLKAPKRAISRAIVQLRDKLNTYKFLDKELSLYQIEDLKDYMNNLKREMITMNVESVVERKKIEREIALNSKKVERAMDERLSVKKILLAFSLTTIAILIGYFPNMLFSYRENAVVFTQSIIEFLVTELIIISVGIVSLFYLKNRLKEKIDAYNNGIRDVISKMKKGVKTYQDYLSALSNYMKAKAYIDVDQKREETKTGLMHLLYLHKRWIAKTARKVEQWRVSFWHR